MRRPVEVIEYDPAWVRTFERIRARVEAAFPPGAVRVEHVGSTSVPGLAAKPVVDVDVVIDADADPVEAIRRLESLGYRHRGDLGLTGREAFRAPEGAPAQHLYLCRTDSAALRHHRAVRDRLRSDPGAARGYAALKRELAATHAGDRDAYQRGKTRFLLAILRDAGTPEDELAEVARVNGVSGPAAPDVRT